jgi:hypothetical protein
MSKYKNGKRLRRFLITLDIKKTFSFEEVVLVSLFSLKKVGQRDILTTS